MSLLRIAAFSDGFTGGNPAGVLIDEHPSEPEMRRIAAEVGYSETAFAEASASGWRVRYFSPQSEVPFCGHATIALGAALALERGDGVFNLSLNNADITVEGFCEGDTISAALQSPATRSEPMSMKLQDQVLNLFGYSTDDIDPNILPARIHGGADHLVFCLGSRAALSAMDYDQHKGRELMDSNGLITIMFAWAERTNYFHSRNAFASGGVLEDPATGAASAAFAGYLRDIDWPHQGAIDILQGEDMGMRSRLRAEINPEPGSSIRVSGSARILET